MSDRIAPAADSLRVVAAVVAAAAAVVALSLYAVPVGLVLGALLASAGGFGAWWASTPRHTLVGSGMVVFGAAALLVGLHAEGLTEAALVAVAVLAGVAGRVAVRGQSAALAGTGAAVVVGATSGGIWTGGALLGADPSWTVLMAMLVLGAAVLGASCLPAALPRPVRAGLETGAAVAAVPAASSGALLAAPADQATWTAVYLTVAGVVVSLLSLLHADRRRIGWAGGVLLAAASWVRLWDVGVHAPEAYTLPSAVALLAVGLVRLHRDPSASTTPALGPGLGLALLPSLLWAVAEPTGLRSLLLGLGCLLLVLCGVRLGWSAPVRAGAAVGAVLVLRMAGPYVGAAVPRWVLIGLAGSLLIVVGATWERRLTEARDLARYVSRLR
jgi:hypothetical protein